MNNSPFRLRKLAIGALVSTWSLITDCP